MQLSKSIEDTFVASYELMQTNEDEDSHTLRQPVNLSAASKDRFEQMVSCQRMANQVADRFLMDLQQADVLVKKVKTQGWQPSTALT
ncbi:hypothetical protein GUITHDRAFT_119999 [Guillardia theta CCMP2712]|uniref:Uncharacterized protein n=1 Tax=Guillardia theta (strain CCMP2712) TaxID=905079 RepID=L1ID57_GUITC|nr:hypothetical protein GUITHDRAFT_119999 [Guillardia theta CCMP2712]EKX33829.1 hypothetical protein GUITHDRAFT_119999 [Guillardia theta CCMP2712]|eukprot:XP_005820809.1 hypothetical protein GUITHDRAFT_119999 [Guillardia theta CCMP2712]